MSRKLHTVVISLVFFAFVIPMRWSKSLAQCSSCSASDSSHQTGESGCASETWLQCVTYSDYPANACCHGSAVLGRACAGNYTSCAGDYVGAQTLLPQRLFYPYYEYCHAYGGWVYKHPSITYSECNPSNPPRLEQSLPSYSETTGASFSRYCTL